LDYYLKLGAKHKHLDKLRKLQKTGQRVKSLEDEANIIPGARWVWAAWEELSSRRLWNESGPQPIQISEMLAYTDYHCIPNGTLREDLYYCLVGLDNKYLGHMRDQRNRQQRQAQQKNKNSTRGLGRK